jgi:hypothetical protein
MAINSSDIKVRQSERMTDFPDGGGRMSATEVVDGQINNVFPDRSDLGAIVGNIVLRKVFTQIDTSNTDTMLGLFQFPTDPPLDPLVHIVAFDTGSPTDQRAQAQAYIENYRLPGTRTRYTLHGLHLAGTMSIEVFCRAEVPSPDIGDVLLLSIEADGYTPHSQAVKVQQVAARVTQTFEDSNGEFQRDVLTILITSALQYEFPGIDEVSRYSAQNQSPTLVRSTQVSDAARYYSVKPCVTPPEIGDLQVNVGTPYLPIVPSTQAETPLVDVLAGLGTLSMIKSGTAAALTHAETITAGAGVSVTRHFGTGFTRRSLNITVSGVALRDNGSGGIVAVDPLNTGWSGEADYTSGSWTIASAAGISAAVSATATPAGGILEQGYSQALNITPANRQQSYVIQLPTLPSPGTITFDYRALDKWIRLTDNGAGQLTGNPGEGTASANYSTGTISATLGALPDVDSAIIVSWGVDLRARDSSGEITGIAPRYRQQLSHAGVLPGTLEMSWLSSGIAKTASVSVDGVVTGDATGSADHAAGRVDFITAHTPDAQITYAYDYVPADKVYTETFTPSASGGAVAITLAHPAAAGSVAAHWNSTFEVSPTLIGLGRQLNFVVADDSSGGWYTPFLGTNSIDYSTGAIVLTVEADVPAWVPEYATRINESTGAVVLYVSGRSLQDVGAKFAAGTPLVVRYIDQGASVTSTSEGHSLPSIRIGFNGGAAGPAVPGSVRFSFRGRTYVDRGGSLVYNVSPVTNAGTVGGSYDYGTNTATITEIGAGTSTTVSIISLLTRYTEPAVNAVMFRTPGAPLKAGSFTIRATTMSGTLLTGSADINGVITGTKVKGQVDWESGLAEVAFGQLVTAAGNEGEIWYDPDAVVGSQVWKPEAVDPASVFFGTVVYRSIPLNPAILGLDPVRLPDDGRVLVFRPGDLLVIHHTEVTSIASPVAGDTEDLGRERLAFAEVYDSEGEPVLDTWYTADLDAGTVEWADPLNLSAYTLPILIRHRIEDAVLCTDAQITGELSLQRAVSHDFPAGTLVSSAILIGDLQSRVTNVFDQGTYQPGVWSDTLVGSPAGATYNTVNYPIEVSNDSAIDEKWAVVFTAPTVVNVIGQTVGQIYSGSITDDIAPINPVSGQPYLFIDKDGWGGGWAAQNMLRLNTVSATKPMWLARVMLPGEITETNDRTRIQIYGNAH